MAHGNTVLAQVLKLIPRSPIEALDKVHGTGRPGRVLSRWSQFGALVFAQLAGRHSLRDVVYSLAAQANALAPLGLRPPQRSTLAEANARRPAALYQRLFTMLYTRCRTVAPKHRFRFKSPLFSLDSTTISLCLSLFPWARFRTTKGAINVHTLLDHARHIPAFVVVTEGKRSDLAVARGLHWPVGSMVAMDRGYIDYQFLFHLHQEGLYFVTRQKVNAQVNVTARFAVNRSTGVTADHDVVLCGPKGQAYPEQLRQVRYRDAATGNRSVFWTNAFHLAAPTIAAI
jgi:putative transposase